MKKKVAFILGKMTQGGPAVSLLNLLQLIDYSKYDVTIILFNPGGIFFNEIPTNIKLKYVKPRGLFCSINDDKLSYLLWFPVRGALKVIGEILIRLFKQKRQIKWKLKKVFLQKDYTCYDIGMTFSIEGSIYYLSEFVNAKIKIGTIATDYISAKLNKDFDYHYFNKLNYLACVSEENGNILKHVFPEFIEKVIVIPTFISPKDILERSERVKGFKDDFDGPRILTLARYCTTKGIDLAIDACSILVKNGFKIRWYVLGNGDSLYFNKLMVNHNIQYNFFLLNPTNNPYPYIKECDIYVQPSRYEGKSVAIMEAKALNKPIVITNFSTSVDNIIHMKEGLVAEMNSKALADSIQMLIESPSLRKQFSNYLKGNFKGNEKDVHRIFDLIK